MASLIEELITTLQKQQVHFNEMLILSEEKANVIAKNNIETLQQITAAETAIIGKNQRLDQKREEIVKNIGIVLNEDHTKLTITKISQIIKIDAESKQLIEIRDKLKETLDALKQQNDINATLIQGSLDYIDFSVNLMREGGLDPQNLTPAKNLFDVKQ
ncbi:MAG: flagellar protein FlgN [Defluviitaleaceae bacterium]|nr:flagellar protein FlgN [Defluviitaleaceae bacterium]